MLIESNTKDEEAKIMSTANLLHERQTKYFNAMDLYIEQLKKQPAEQAKTEALSALKRTGVVSKSGKRKKKIVSWE